MSTYVWKSLSELDAEIEKLSGEVRLLCELVKNAPDPRNVDLWAHLNKVLEARDRLCNERGDALMCNL